MDEYMILLEALNNYYNDFSEDASERFSEMIDAATKDDPVKASETAWLAGNWRGQLHLIEMVRDSINGEGDFMPWINAVKAEQNNG